MEQDIAIYFWSLKDTLLFDVFQIITGKLYIFLTCAAFVIYAFLKQKRKALIFILAAVIAVAVSDIMCYRVLKPAIKRPRPSVELNFNGMEKTLNNEKNLQKKYYSMPSNHASNIFAFFIIYFSCIIQFF